MWKEIDLSEEQEGGQHGWSLGAWGRGLRESQAPQVVGGVPCTQSATVVPFLDHGTRREGEDVFGFFLSKISI